ncbi:MAG: nucleotide exchange factor GrpE [Phycisphaerales bacterium]
MNTEARDRQDDRSVEAGATGGPEEASSAETSSESARHEELVRERDDAIARYQRALADYQNFQRRSVENERRARMQAISDLVRDLLPALDNLDLALTQEIEGDHLQRFHDGIRLIRDELFRALAGHGAEVFEAAPGEPFDPNRHEAMMHVPSDEIDPHHVVEQLQTGYRMGDIILRPAKVSVARPSTGE